MENEEIVAENEVEFDDGAVEQEAETTENETGEVATHQEVDEVQVDNKAETKRVAARIKEATEKARQEAIESHKGIKLIENLAKKSNMTVEEYVAAVEQQEEDQKIKEIAEKNGIPEDFAKKFAELEKKTTTLEKTQKELEKQKQETQEFNDFFEFYKQDSGKPLTDINEIPQEVYNIKNKTGKSLTDSYIAYQYNEMKKAKSIITKNEENAGTTTGSIEKGAVKDNNFISLSEFEKNKSNRSWVAKNLGKIANSRLKW